MLILRFTSLSFHSGSLTPLPLFIFVSLCFWFYLCLTTCLYVSLALFFKGFVSLSPKELFMFWAQKILSPLFYSVRLPSTFPRLSECVSLSLYLSLPPSHLHTSLPPSLYSSAPTLPPAPLSRPTWVLLHRMRWDSSQSIFVSIWWFALLFFKICDKIYQCLLVDFTCSPQFTELLFNPPRSVC